jgi:hypothetical protein
MVSGGTDLMVNWLASVEVYDPSMASWTAAASMAATQREHISVRLATGKVLIAGYYAPNSGLYDPATDSWSWGPAMNTGRLYHVAARLKNGKVLVVGGMGPMSSAELYDPAVPSWTTIPPMGTGHVSPAATLLQDGQVLVVGGGGPGGADLATAELYDPRLTQGAPCDMPSDCLSGFCVDEVCCNFSCIGTCLACTTAKKGAGTDGTCDNIAAATDPDNECPDLGAQSCGTDGVCDGMGACEKYKTGTPCSAPSCAGSEFIHSSTCDGTGTCLSGDVTDCGLFTCTANTCLTTCADDTECAGAAYCYAPSCVGKVADGDPCTAPNQCQGGVCIDGLCGDSYPDAGPSPDAGNLPDAGPPNSDPISFYGCTTRPLAPTAPSPALLTLAGLLLAASRRRPSRGQPHRR